MTQELAFRPWPVSADYRPRSLWVQQALEAADPDSWSTLEGPVDADVCVVGGGFSGLWTANRLLEHEQALRVAVLEADYCGAGASGRNGGTANHYWPKLASLVELVGRDDALRIVDASVTAVDEIETFCTEHGVDCGLRRGHWLWSATNAARTGSWESMRRVADRLGVAPPYRALSPEERRELPGAGPFFAGAGLVQDNVVRVQPALLARGLMRVASERGATVFERSPVTRIARSGGRLAVETSRGCVTADKVVLAANAWMAHMPELRNGIMVVSSDLVATVPVGDVLEATGWDAWPAGIDSRTMLSYYGVSADRRVIVGRAGGTLAFDARIDSRFDLSLRQTREVAQDLRFLFPELRQAAISHAWAGPVDRSPTGLPTFGRLPAWPDVSYGIGYTGHGIAATVLGGHILASIALERSDEWTALAEILRRAQHGRFPPEPARYLGGLAVRGATFRKDMAERHGRPVRRIDRALARLATATFGMPRRRARERGLR